MTAVTRFEDLIDWQEARKLMQLAYKVTSEGSFAKDFEMRDQFRSAALSSMTNIAEGFDNESSAEFARFRVWLAVPPWKSSRCVMPPWMSNTLPRMFSSLL